MDRNGSSILTLLRLVGYLKRKLSACSVAYSLGPEEEDMSRSECAVSFRLMKISKDVV